MCSGSRQEDNYETSISYKSMIERLDVPAPISSDTVPLKSCMRKQSARANLRPRFASDVEPLSLLDTVVDSTPERLRNVTYSVSHSDTRILSSTAVDSPVIAFSNATYAGKFNQSKKN